MKKFLYSAVIFTGCALANPAQATVQVCDGPSCAPWDTNVNITANSSPVVGVTNSKPALTVNFTSSVDTLIAPPNGLARVEAQDGVLNGLTFALAGGYTFGSAMFNLDPLSGNPAGQATGARITWLLSGGGTAFQDISLNVGGQNDTGVFGDAGERLLSITFLTTPPGSGINDLRQLRLGNIQGPEGTPNPQAFLPEPATWAMMLVGFGFVGTMMRRRNRHPSVRLTYS